MSRSKFACALALAALPQAALAQSIDFTGVYYQGAAQACKTIGIDGGAIQIEDNLFRGVESECRMTRPVNVVNMDAMLFDMDCSGEGEEWEARAMFMNAASGGLIMVWDGFAFEYARCKAEDLAVADAPTADEDDAPEAGTEDPSEAEAQPDAEAEAPEAD